MTDAIPPLAFRWTDDEVLVPLSKGRAAQHYCVGEVYRMAPYEERSQASHNHFFAAVHDAWLNLPDRLATDYPTAEHLRKAALVATGHYLERRFFASSAGEARKIAAFLKPTDEFAVISVAGNVVVERKAKSQSMRAMGKPTFQKSKQDCLDWISDLIGVSAQELSAEAGRAA